MKASSGIWLVVLLLLIPFFASGCGCGGEAVDLVSIEVTPENPGIALGTHQQFAATGIFSNGDKRDITKHVKWSSSDIAIADISNNTETKGLAASRAIGSTLITATSGHASGSTTLTVTAASLVSISVSPENPTTDRGLQQQFKATGTFTDNTTQDITTSVDWTSSVVSIAAISNDAGSKGLATGINAGVTIITAASGDISGSTSLTVTPISLIAIEVSPQDLFVGFRATIQYTATGIFSDGTRRNLTTVVTWSSSNPSFATISNDPGSKGLASTDSVPGSTVIKATIGSIWGATQLTDP